jgi:exosortase
MSETANTSEKRILGGLPGVHVTSAMRWLTGMRPSKHDGLFAALVAILVVLSAPALASVLELSRQDASASHLPLIPLVSLGLLLLDRPIILRKTRLALIPGGTVILVGVAILAWAELAVAGQNPNLLTIRTLAIAIATIGAFIACYGPAAARAGFFPLAFLLFMIPLPPALLGGLVGVLKVGSTEVANWLFALTGTTYHRDGFVFSLPTLVIEVADECSGIRSTIALLLTSMLAGHTFLRSPWKKVALVLMVVPVSVVKNGIRIVSLSLLSVHLNPGLIEGRLHRDGGILFFLMGLALLAPILAALRRSEDASMNPERTNHSI